MNQRSFNSAFWLGVTAGLRSMTAPAVLAWTQQRSPDERLWLLRDSRTWRVLSVLALGELVLDKLPFAPNRTSPGALSGRMISGALCGAAVVREDEGAGAVLGIVGALAGSFAGYFLRKGVRRVSGLPDTLIALAEDATAIGIGVAAAESGSREEGLKSRLRRVA